MFLSSKRKRSQQGTILIMTLVVAVLIGVVLASFLALVASQHRSVMRSLAWNSAIPIMEAPPSAPTLIPTRVKYQSPGKLKARLNNMASTV